MTVVSVPALKYAFDASMYKKKYKLNEFKRFVINEHFK